ncbi:DMT family transporter [Actinocrispum wychmicini]|uniref:Threonine/homoserine efflux transporter RhtA n=1 Tax=Actinocrispum wychmicini TaxID=1213861 RepID=A0A4R2J683_9PSEU|nr:DMT family transporter [Actinocrispum wychmicini]TCO50665.1 threonine/homoserine efflux transporter RhtA [Actinocrispum wychmicini]
MRTYLMLVLVMAFWGSAFASSKIAVQAIPHEVAASLRFAIGAVILLVMHTVLSRHRVSRRDLGKVAGLGMLGVFGYNMFFFFALSLAPSSDGSVIVPVLTPVITVAVTAVTGRQRLSTRVMLGLATAVAGAVVFFAGIPAGGSGRLVGDLLFLGAAGCWVAYTICGAPLLKRLPAFTVTTFASTAGAIALALVAIPSFGDVHWAGLTAGFWVNQLYLAALPTALAYVMYYAAIREVGPATAASAMFLVPVFGLACSWLLVDESITPVQAVGSACMLLGAWLATVRRTTVRAGWEEAALPPPSSQYT